MVNMVLRVVVAVLAASVGLGLVGCGGSGPAPGSGPVPPVHLRHLFFLDAWGPGDNSHLEIVTPRGRVIRRVATVPFNAPAVLSPSGKLVAWSGSSGIVIERLDGSARRLVTGTEPNEAVVWSPDSTAILAGDENGSLDVVSVATGAKQQIAEEQPGSWTVPLAWLPSHKILYASAGPSHDNADPVPVVFAAESGAFLHTIYNPGNQVPSVYVSPNGAWVNLLLVDEGNGEPSSSYFETINAATGKRVGFRSFNQYGGTAWSPDSRRLVAGELFGPLKTFSPAGKVLSTIQQSSLEPVAWTRDALYLFPGPGRPDSQEPGTIYAIPTGRTTAHIAFTLPGQEILSIQAF